MEKWKTIAWGDGKYQVSACGNVRNNKTGRLLTLHLKKSGYYQVQLTAYGIKKFFLVHRLVAQAFIPNPNNLPSVNHKDENKKNNFVWVNDDGTVDLEKSNLEWCTVAYNNSFGNRAQKSSTTQLNDKKKSIPICQFDKNGTFLKLWPSGAEIERQLGFDQGNISACCTGKLKTSYGYIWKKKEAV